MSDLILWAGSCSTGLRDDYSKLLERIEKLEAALRELLEDTQHAEHACSWAYCPVRNARAALGEDKNDST